MALNKACKDAIFISLPKAPHGNWNGFLTDDALREAADDALDVGGRVQGRQPDAVHPVLADRHRFPRQEHEAMIRNYARCSLAAASILAATPLVMAGQQADNRAASAGGAPPAVAKTITEADCTAGEAGLDDPGERHRAAGVCGHARRAAVARGGERPPGLLQHRRQHGAGGHGADGEADPLRRGAARGLERPRGAARRRRHERDDPAADRRRRAHRRAAHRAGIRHLRERLGTPGSVGPPPGAGRGGREGAPGQAPPMAAAPPAGAPPPAAPPSGVPPRGDGAAGSRGERLGAQRRGGGESRLHAAEEDARRGHGPHRAGLRREARASTTSSATRRAAARR